MRPQEEHNELKDVPFLRSIAKEDPFVTPQGFFEVFPQNVQQRMQALRSERKGWTLWPRFAVGSLAAMAIAALLWSLWPTAPVNTEGLATAEPEELLDAGVDEEILFAALAGEEDLMEPVALPDDDVEVLAYLENEDLPLDQLIEDL
ncbi:MAG: hypothetical protein JNM62_11100 [Flavobacteriales bacterium]|nr:hypothetical protein [Flavobacteriales bacterium]